MIVRQLFGHELKAGDFICNNEGQAHYKILAIHNIPGETHLLTAKFTGRSIELRRFQKSERFFVIRPAGSIPRQSFFLSELFLPRPMFMIFLLALIRRFPTAKVDLVVDLEDISYLVIHFEVPTEEKEHVDVFLEQFAREHDLDNKWLRSSFSSDA